MSQQNNHDFAFSQTAQEQRASKKANTDIQTQVNGTKCELLDILSVLHALRKTDDTRVRGLP